MIFTASLLVSMRVVEHLRGPEQVTTTKSGKTILLPNLEMVIQPLRREFISQIGQEL